MREHYGDQLQESALLSLVDLEKRGRHEVQGVMEHATRNCTNAYQKGKRSIEVFAKLETTTLTGYLPSFKRASEILKRKLSA